MFGENLARIRLVVWTLDPSANNCIFLTKTSKWHITEERAVYKVPADPKDYFDRNFIKIVEAVFFVKN